MKTIPDKKHRGGGGTEAIPIFEIGCFQQGMLAIAETGLDFGWSWNYPNR
jgi:hypothetical protein